MALHRFTIKAPMNRLDTVIELDGKPLRGVCGVSFEMKANGDPNILHLQVTGEIEIEGEFRREDIISVRRNLAF